MGEPAGPKNITDAEREQRRLKAMQLRISGYGYREIGRMLGVSDTQAYYDVMHEIRLQRAQLAEVADDMRTIETQRLDKILNILDARIEAGDIDCIEPYLKVAARRAKLLGLDAAGKVDVNVTDHRSELKRLNPAELEVRRRIALERIQKSLPAGSVVEAEVIQAQTVESPAPAAHPVGPETGQIAGNTEQKRDD